MSLVPFRQVDVFTTVPFQGNPVAVVLDGNPLSSAGMQAIANWTNLSETTFVCTPAHAEADYRLRIFTPKSEMAFAGHPTIGSAHAMLEHGLKPKRPGRLVQECGRGLVTIEIDGERLFLALPKPDVRELSAAQSADLTAALGVDAQRVLARATVDVGVAWVTLQLADAGTVRSLQPDQARLRALTPSGVAGVTVFGFYDGGVVPHVEVRSFAPAEGIAEDPVCGSGNGCVAALIRQERLFTQRQYVAGQGRCLGRDGRVEIRYADDGTIWLGGHAVTCVQGTLVASLGKH